MIRDKQILITGGSGFIGSALVRRLVDANSVVVFDNGHRDAREGSGLLAHPNVYRVGGDVLDFDAVRRAIGGVRPRRPPGRPSPG